MKRHTVLLFRGRKSKEVVSTEVIVTYSNTIHVIYVLSVRFWDHLFGKELFILFTASAFRKLPSIYVFSYFPFGFEGRIWDLIVSVPYHCLSFYFESFIHELIPIFSTMLGQFGYIQTYNSKIVV